MASRAKIKQSKINSKPLVTNPMIRNPFIDPVKSRMYTYNELVMAMAKVKKETIEDVRQSYDMIYTVAAACALNAEPYRFGKKRVCNFMRLFFDQIEAMSIKTVDADDMLKMARKVGVDVYHENGKYIVHIDDTPKSKKIAAVIKTIGGKS